MLKTQIEKNMPYFSHMVKQMNPEQKKEIKELLEKNRKEHKSFPHVLLALDIE